MHKGRFLMLFCCFVAQQGTFFKVISDHGTHFIRGERELQEVFDQLSSALQEQLTTCKAHPLRNPPHAPHFGGT